MSSAGTIIEPADIRSWHAHLYFSDHEAALAERVREQAGKALPVSVGRMHHRPVGPHPRGSCQLEFAADDVRVIVDWLTCHRQGLTVFMHPNTGQELPDHRDRAIWFGPSEVLDLEVLKRL